MIAERTRAKTENLSLRLDPKTKFMLDFMARLRSQSITAVVEQSIREAVNDIGLGENWNHGERSFSHRWNDFWDPSEGVRVLKLFSVPSYPTTFEEDELRQFTLDHWQFFFTDSKGQYPRRGYVDIIWPRISDFLTIWRNKKTTSYWSAGEAMSETLTAAGVKPPTPWPPRETTKSPSIADELDDDIPF